MSDTVPFDEAKLFARLQSMPPNRRVAFAAAVAERLLHAYERYELETGQPGTVVLRQVLAHLWRDLESLADRHPMRESIDRVEQLLPITEAGWTFLSGLAEVAVLAALYALRTAESGDSREAVWAAQQAVDGADMLARATDAPSLVKASELLAVTSALAAELALQQTDLDTLSSQDPTVITTVKERSRHPSNWLLART